MCLVCVHVRGVCAVVLGLGIRLVLRSRRSRRADGREARRKGEKNVWSL